MASVRAQRQQLKLRPPLENRERNAKTLIVLIKRSKAKNNRLPQQRLTRLSVLQQFTETDVFVYI